LAATLARSRVTFACIGLYSGAINILMLTGSLFMLQVYDRVLPSRSVPTLVALLTIVAFVFGVQAVLEAIRTRMLTRVSRRLDEDLSGLAFRSTVSPSFTAGGERADPMRDLDQVRQFFATPGPAALFDMPWTPLYLAMCFMFHPLLGWLTVAGALIVSVLALFGEVRSRVSSKRSARMAAQRQGVVDCARRNTEVLGTMNLLARFEQRFRAANPQFLAAHQKGSDGATGVSAAVRALRNLLQSGVLALAAYLAIQQEISSGTIIAASILASRALAPIDVAVSQWRQFVAARLAAGRLKRSLAAIGDAQPLTRLPAPRSRLEVHDGSVAPPGTRVATVSGISFAVQAGDGLGIIGPSGSGKTTLARAITGTWPLARGEIALDGAPLHQYSAEDRGAAIGYLPQDVDLFNGTIADNIARFEPDHTDEAVVRAAQLADVHDMILKFQNGYDTRIGDGGLQLSAGQRQRIGLARALYGDPFLVVLDEPYSNLDGEGDAALNRALAAVRARGGIVVLIAHRRSAIGVVNKVIVIADGRQVAFGPKDQVLSQIAAPPGDARKVPATGPVVAKPQLSSNVTVLSHASR